MDNYINKLSTLIKEEQKLSYNNFKIEYDKIVSTRNPSILTMNSKYTSLMQRHVLKITDILKQKKEKEEAKAKEEAEAKAKANAEKAEQNRIAAEEK